MRFYALGTITSVVLLCFVAESNAQTVTKKVTVEAKVVSVDTKVKIEVGDIVEVTEVTGKFWTNSDKSVARAWKGVEGGWASGPTHRFKNAKHAALVAYIGDPKNHYQVVEDKGVEAKTAGNLFFAINETGTDYKDNSGELVVTYQITKKGAKANLPNKPILAQPKVVTISKEEQEKFDKMLKEKKAQTGANDIKISLFWKSKNDLDLRVTDPKNEEVSFQLKKSKSGGFLDVDTNEDVKKSSDNGIEHIVWPTGKAPKGKYTIKVQLWDKRDAPAITTPFKVQLTLMNGQTKTFEGVLVKDDQVVTVAEFEVK